MTKKIKTYIIQKKIFYCVSILMFLLIIFCLLYKKMEWKVTALLPHDCFFPVFFKLYCPGCGGTRALHALLQGDILKSMYFHPLVVYATGIMFYYYFMGVYTFCWKKDGKIYYSYSNWILYLAVAIVLVYAIMRNILLKCFGIDWIGDILASV